MDIAADLDTLTYLFVFTSFEGFEYFLLPFMVMVDIDIDVDIDR